jgi:hypothetical protein
MKQSFLFLLLFSGLLSAQNQPLWRVVFIDSLLESAVAEEIIPLYMALPDSMKEHLSRRIAAVNAMDDLECTSICDVFRAQRERYDHSVVPQAIASLYTAASEYVENDRLREAVQLYTVAIVIRNSYIESEKERLLRQYEKTKRILALGNIDSLSACIDAFSEENSLSPGYRILDEEYRLSDFYRSIARDLEPVLVRRRYELEHTDYFENILTIGIRGAGRISTGIKSPPFRRTDYITETEGRFPSFPLTDYQYSAFITTFAAAVSYKVFPSLHIESEFASTSFVMTNLFLREYDSNDFIFFEDDRLPVTSYEITLAVRYLFRHNIGFRPFLISGIGMSYSATDDKTLLAEYRYTFYALQQTNVAWFLPVTMGVEYVRAKNSSWFLDVAAGGYFYFPQNAYSGTFAASFRFGINVVVL